MAKRSKSKRRRVDREHTRRNAAEGSSTGRDFFKLPKGVTEWAPDKKGRYEIDIVPYEVSDTAHPDKVEAGYLWYKRLFFVHRNVGVNNNAVVCPSSIGKKCPICEERHELAKDWDENAELIKPLNYQKWVAFNIIDPDDDDAIRLFAMSYGKFAKTLEAELAEGDEADLLFYDLTDDGRTVKVRFSEDDYEGRKFIKATRIDFVERAGMDEDEILEKVVDLDECLLVLSYKKLKAMFLQVDDDDDDDKKGKKGKKGKKKADDDDDDDDDDDQAPALAKGDRVTAEIDDETYAGVIKKIKGDMATVKFDDGDVDDFDLEDLTAEAEEDDSDDGDDDGDDIPFEKGDRVTAEIDGEIYAGKIKKIKGDTATVTFDDGDVDDFDLEDLTAEDADDDDDDDDSDDDDDGKKGKKGKKIKCPAGGKFGKDVDKFDECDKCEHWDACDEANG